MIDTKALIKKARQEAHMCNAGEEGLAWIDWFDTELNDKNQDEEESAVGRRKELAC